MRKCLLLFIFFAVVSCSEEDEPQEKEAYRKSDLHDTWEVESVEFEGYEVALNDCNSQSTLYFVAEDVIVTSAYIHSEVEECIVNNFEYDYTIEGKSIFIKKSGNSNSEYYAELTDGSVN